MPKYRLSMIAGNHWRFFHPLAKEQLSKIATELQLNFSNAMLKKKGFHEFMCSEQEIEEMEEDNEKDLNILRENGKENVLRINNFFGI